MVGVDGLAIFSGSVVLLASFLTVLLSIGNLSRDALPAAEYYALLLFATIGMLMMVQAPDLMMVFIGLEVLSISLYALAGIARGRLVSSEAALKYLLLGAFASGFLVYGMALIYGAAGTTNLLELARVIDMQEAAGSRLLQAGVALLLVGFVFKISSVPFHMWAPDVYQGSPSFVAGFMSTAVKMAAFATLLRTFIVGLGAFSGIWSGVLAALAVLTMTLGNVVALHQSNLKRLLAYSSIAHAGYLLVGASCVTTFGEASVLFYALAYTLTNLGAFAFVLLASGGGEDRVEVSDYAGLAHRRPLLAMAMTVFLLSLAGIPPTGGFVGKLYLFTAAVENGKVWLAVAGVLNSLVSAFYYLRVIATLYMREPEGEMPPRVPALSGLALAIAVYGILQLGLFPAYFMDLARRSVEFLM
jgi:NADH-quinone oxidoreductase subunit N